MKKLLQILSMSLIYIFIFSSSVFASELMDFSGFIDKSKAQAKLFSTKYVLLANNWMTCEYKIKPILMSGYEWSNKQRISASVKTFDKDGTVCNTYYSKVTDFNVWSDIKINTRIACSDESFDRYVGLGASFPYIKVAGNRAKVVKYEFSGVKGNYNGDAYDAICTCYCENGPALVVLYKDVRIDTTHKCTYLDPKKFTAEDCQSDEFNYYAIRFDGNTIKNSKGEIELGYSNIGWFDKNYKIHYDCDPEYEYDGHLCSHLDYVNTYTISSGTYTAPPSISDGPITAYIEYYDEEDKNMEPCYNENSITENKMSEYISFCRIGIIKPSKVTKDGKSINVTYQFDANHGTFKNFDYDCQILYKDGNTVFARVLYKNFFANKEK